MKKFFVVYHFSDDYKSWGESKLNCLQNCNTCPSLGVFQEKVNNIEVHLIHFDVKFDNRGFSLKNSNSCKKSIIEYINSNCSEEDHCIAMLHGRKLPFTDKNDAVLQDLNSNILWHIFSGGSDFVYHDVINYEATMDFSRINGNWWESVKKKIKGIKGINSFILPALSILCQGYLAAHFPEPSRASGIVEQALQKMGWSEFAASEEGKELAQRAASQKDKTAKPGWWKKAFENMEKEDLGRKLGEEWGDEDVPNEVYGLQEAIFGEAKLDDKESGKKVAGAYLEIAKNLRGKMS